LTPAAIGILGGTFDPIHFGHLRLAQEVAQTLALHQIRFVPACAPPHRAAPQTAAQQRVAMVRLAIAGNPLFVLDDREIHRAGPSYTVDTLAAIRAEVGAACALTLIMGADAFIAFHTWYRWREILNIAHIAVAQRPGATLCDIKDAALAQVFGERCVHDTQPFTHSPAGMIAVVPIPLLDISATAIRAAITAGRSVRYLTPDAVIGYINDQQLFKDTLIK